MEGSKSARARKPEGRVTLTRVAEEAKVAVSTVSFVLNDAPLAKKLTPETRERVWAAARKLGYRPNELARAMVKGRTRVIAFCLPFVAMEWVARTLDGFVMEASKGNFFVKTVPMHGDDWREVFAQAMDAKPAAVVVHELFREQEEWIAREAAAHHVLCAGAGTTAIRKWDVSAAPDTADAARQVVHHLAELGHRRILHLGGNPDLASGVTRERDYRRAMLEQGLKPDVVWAHFRLEDAERAVRERLREKNSPTAIYCANDPMAMVVLRTVRAIGLRVPDDVSVVGYSDLMMAHLADPALTSVNELLTEVGISLGKCLLTKMQAANPAGSSGHVLVRPRLEVRSSTGPAPH
ncbi:MAG: LacI family DNA-binding transcriptional regulator [Terrimicrobiaceae bacterium]|nr:LacI family DNA-binding transcriptional regulator [Terrimicrobiaceae bacterium]